MIQYSGIQLFSYDLGYGMNKVFGPSNVRRAFRSSHGITHSELPSAMGVDATRQAIRLNDSSHMVFGDYGESVVGKRFMHAIGGDRVSDPNFLYYFGAAIASEFQPGILSVHVVYGLPVEDMENQNLKRRIVTALKRPDLWTRNHSYAATDEELGIMTAETPFTFHTPDGKYIVVVERVTFMAQPMGSAWNFLLSENNCALDAARLEDLKSQKWMVIDVGSGTLDISTITRGIPTTGESGTLEGGVNFLVERLQAILTSDYNLPAYSRHTLQQILETGLAPDPSQAEGVRQVWGAVQKAKDDLWSHVVSFLVSSTGKAYEYQFILVTGGGGILLIDHIKEYFNAGGISRVVLSQQPMFDNVVGWYKYVNCVVLGNER